ncbi:MAG: FHA domain-containing protein [Leptolyngbya sp. PLA3]|nr:MAG: FHA domain-containing protein [Cyanobacteria bacterium CYA]MCE7968523.1 FHA domain-containing protein [Leptolyngbya sp. PL-A3]
MATLQLKVEGGRGRPIRLDDDPITIGRHPDNRIRIKDEMASRHHCIIEPAAPGQFRLRDLGSRNGTKLNGNRVAESLLQPGDVIQIGQLQFQVEERRNEVTARVGADGNGEQEAPTTRQSRREQEQAPWIVELKSVIDAFAVSGVDDENIRIVDADGKTSDALAGANIGPRSGRLLLRAASRTRATDIHLEPKGESVNVRMRVDGQMVWVTELPNDVGERFVGLIKNACQMKAAARDAVQDGHFSCRFPDRRVEYRVSVTPSVHGQKMVIRVLDQRGVPTSLSDLGLVGYMHERIRAVTTQDSGLLLVCGPTGSGKTTTLYNALREIDRDARNVVTIEDPVEYQLDGVTQMPIDERKGNTFNSLLRSVLRQDPDVILVGEVRDEETARTAMQAAMTGHLVFTTVHSKDSISAVFRLLDLRVEPYLVANALNLVLAQRLVRVLCEKCKQEIPVTPGQANKIGRFLAQRTHIFAPVGCPSCIKTGFRGRHALFELLDFNDELRDIVLRNPSIQAMRKVIDQGLFTTLQQFGYRLVAEGVTSMDEVDRVAGSG